MKVATMNEPQRNFNEQATVLITGGAGFIGSNLVHYLRRERPGWRIIVVDKLTYAGNAAYLDGLTPPVELVKLDLADEQALRSLIGERRPELVFHLAAESHVDRSISGPRPFIESNIVGTYSLLEALRALPRTAKGDGPRLVHVSTDEVYGDLGPDDPAFDETTAYDPSSPYSASKAASDHLASAWQHTFGLDVVITNCSNNFGPRQYPEKLIPVVIRKLRDREAIPVYGDGSNVRDWLYVEDHCAALLAAAERGVSGEKYNIGTSNELTNLELVELLCDLYDEISGTEDSRALVHFVSDRPGHDRRYAINPDKTRRELGWRPQHPFGEALDATLRWYLAHLASLWGM